MTVRQLKAVQCVTKADEVRTFVVGGCVPQATITAPTLTIRALTYDDNALELQVDFEEGDDTLVVGVGAVESYVPLAHTI